MWICAVAYRLRLIYLFKFRGESSNPLRISVSLLCSPLFGGDLRHDTKAKRSNFEKNDCVKTFTNLGLMLLIN